MMTPDEYVNHVVQPMIWILLILWLFCLPVAFAFWWDFIETTWQWMKQRRSEREAVERFREAYRQEAKSDG